MTEDSENKDWFDDILTQHEAAVGRISNLWNKLHDAMGEMFAATLGGGRIIGLSAWQSCPSDRGKRAMLLAVLRVKHGVESKAFTEMKWACDQANSQEEHRNNTAHSAFTVAIHEGALRLEPVLYTENPRAQKLRDKDLIDALQIYASNIRELMFFTQRVSAAASPASGIDTWPERPRLREP